MIVALSWLTVSAPFVFASQQETAKHTHTALADLPIAGSEEEANPLNGSTEEKAPKTLNSVSEEYLHDHFIHDHFFLISSQSYKCEKVDTYITYHGELLVPPPNQA